MQLNFFKHNIIVIIPTSSRTNLLLERSLKSIYQQTNINPQHIYVVDDNSIEEGKQYSNEYFQIEKGIKNLREGVLIPKFDLFKQKINNQNIPFKKFFETSLIQNTRTKHFSGTGAWNSGAFEAFKNYSSKNDVFLAFLDDDDEWKENYLETLYKKVTESEKEIIAVVSGIKRIESPKEIKKIVVTKENFIKESFFIGNPGLQGSNLFIDLKTFWAIGGFDESLKSTTDRDLAIRLIQYKNTYPRKEIVFIDDVLVNHYACSEDRVTAISENKKQGLNLFYRKYLHQFSKEIQKKSLDRAKNLFNYEPSKESNDTINKIEKPIINSFPTCNKTLNPFNLIIGTISNNTKNLETLFQSFSDLYQKHKRYLNDYQFIVLENGNKEEIRSFCSKENLNINLNIDLNITCIDNISNTPRSIAENRTVLQREIIEEGKKFNTKNYITWIIDDDHFFKLDNNIIPNYFEVISKYSNTKIDAMFGQVADAPPLPFLSTLRCQLIDFYYNLTYFSNCNPKKNFELNTYQKNKYRWKDFYHDLSSDYFQHLEYPYYEDLKKKTNFQSFKLFLEMTQALPNGVNAFRKIKYKTEKFGNLLNEESIYRGGNTIIFNSELLKVPNYSPNNVRRSDFNWAIINKYIFKRKLCEISLPLKHNRESHTTSFDENFNKLKRDIEGSIFYRLLKNILSQKDWESNINYEQHLYFYNETKRKIFSKVKMNHYRILFLMDLILEILSNKKSWWYENLYKDISNNIQQNIDVIKLLRNELEHKFLINLLDLENNLRINNLFIDEIRLDMKKIKLS